LVRLSRSEKKGGEGKGKGKGSSEVLVVLFARFFFFFSVCLIKLERRKIMLLGTKLALKRKSNRLYWFKKKG
jgi:hypothetical protein